MSKAKKALCIITAAILILSTLIGVTSMVTNAATTTSTVTKESDLSGYGMIDR